MDSITDTEWDIVIAGTGLPQSLLALALSRSGKKVLHIDANEYYGGPDVALSLQDAEEWVQQAGEGAGSSFSVFSDISINQRGGEDTVEDERNTENGNHELGSSRAYNLALSPQIIYMKSAFLSMLVSSKIFRQLEFMAVGSWFVYNANETKSDHDPIGTRLQKIPSSREDVFTDRTMGMKAKRSLINFQRLFRDPVAQDQALEVYGKHTLKDYLTNQYDFPESLQEAVNALTLSPDPPSRTLVNYALPRIARHVMSMGISGSGFGAVIPKWGGLAEIAQVACRAQAVGGGVYMLGKGIKKVNSATEKLSEIILSDGTSVKTRLVAGATADLQTPVILPSVGPLWSARSIFVVSFGFAALFSRLADDGPKPVVAIVSFPAGSLSVGKELSRSPIYLMIHSSESGECPKDQCIVYASMIDNHNPTMSFAYLRLAIDTLLDTFGQKIHQTLWSLSYKRQESELWSRSRADAIQVRDTSIDLALDDSMLQEIRSIWEMASGDRSDFMVFADREIGAYDDDDNDNDDND